MGKVNNGSLSRMIIGRIIAYIEQFGLQDKENEWLVNFFDEENGIISYSALPLFKENATNNRIYVSELIYSIKDKTYDLVFFNNTINAIDNRIKLNELNYNSLQKIYGDLKSPDEFKKYSKYVNLTYKLIKEEKFKGLYLFYPRANRTVVSYARNRSSYHIDEYSFGYSNITKIHRDEQKEECKELTKIEEIKLERGAIFLKVSFFNRLRHPNSFPWFNLIKSATLTYKLEDFFKIVLPDLMYALDNGVYLNEREIRLINLKHYTQYKNSINENYISSVRRINVATGSANIELVDLEE